MRNEQALTYERRIFLPFTDHSFRWVDLKLFVLPDEDDDEARTLGLLLAHPSYRDHYASSDSHEQPTENIHGPYWLDRLSIDSFEVVNEETAIDTFRRWSEQFSEVPDSLRQDLDEFVYPLLRDATSRYRLKNLRADSEHEWGWVLGEFLELVLLNRSQRRLALLVASDD